MKEKVESVKDAWWKEECIAARLKTGGEKRGNDGTLT